MTFFLFLTSVLLIGFGFIYSFFLTKWFIIVIIVGIFIQFGWKKIPVDPPQIGLLTIWGRPTNKIFGGGLHLLANYFPFNWAMVLLDASKQDRDFTFENVRCKFETDEEDIGETPHNESEDGHKAPKSGGSVKIVVSLTYILDKSRPWKFVESNQTKGVEAILDGIIGEDLRQLGRDRTWEEMTFGSDIMSVRLIKEIVGENPDCLQGKGEINESEAFKFLQKALVNGVSDVLDLGVKILRLNIKQVEEEGELKEEAGKLAKERLQRRQELFELETDTLLAETMYKAIQKNTNSKTENSDEVDSQEENSEGNSSNKTFDDCLKEVRRRRSIREGYGHVYEFVGGNPQKRLMLEQD